MGYTDAMKTSSATPNQRLFQRLWNAAGRGNIDAIDTTLQAGAKINGQGEGGRTPLIAAVAGGQVVALKHLIEKGARLDIRDDQDETAIIHGLKGRRPLDLRFEMIRSLAAAGAKTNVNDTLGVPLSHSVAKQFSFENLQELIALKMPLTGTSNLNNETFIHSLAEVGRFDQQQVASLIGQALQQGVNLEAMNSRRRTALAVTAEQDRPEIAQALLERGAKLENVLDLALREKVEGWIKERNIAPVLPAPSARRRRSP